MPDEKRPKWLAIAGVLVTALVSGLGSWFTARGDVKEGYSQTTDLIEELQEVVEDQSVELERLWKVVLSQREPPPPPLPNVGSAGGSARRRGAVHARRPEPDVEGALEEEEEEEEELPDEITIGDQVYQKPTPVKMKRPPKELAF